MVIVKCSNCKKVAVKKKGMDVDTNKLPACKHCGNKSFDVDIKL